LVSDERDDDDDDGDDDGISTVYRFLNGIGCGT